MVPPTLSFCCEACICLSTTLQCCSAFPMSSSSFAMADSSRPFSALATASAAPWDESMSAISARSRWFSIKTCYREEQTPVKL